MAQRQRFRHLRHRRLAGLDRGPAARPRLRKGDAYFDAIAATLSATATAVACTVTNATNVLTAAANGLEVGEIVQVVAAGVPGGLAATTDYYVSPIDDDDFYLCASRENAFSATAIELSSDGTSVTVVREVDRDAIVALAYAGVTPEQLAAASDIDAI